MKNKLTLLKNCPRGPDKVSRPRWAGFGPRGCTLPIPSRVSLYTLMYFKRRIQARPGLSKGLVGPRHFKIFAQQHFFKRLFPSYCVL